MTDLNYWFHGDDPVYTLLAADDPVNLHDDSGNNRAVSQESPALYTIGERTHPVLDFFSSHHYRITATSQFCTLYAALRAPYFNGYRRLMQGHNDGVNVDVQSAPENAGVTLYSGSALSVARSLNTWSVITGIFNGVDSFLIINGVTYQQGDLGAHTCDDFVLGGEYNSTPGNWFDGYLADIANFSVVHDDATLTLVLGEIMDFWGITKPTATVSFVTIDNISPTVLQQINASTDVVITTFSDRTRYQWKADNVVIPGATGESYIVQSVDYGKDIRCTVIPANRWGDGVSRTTDATAVVAQLQLQAPGGFASNSSAELTWTLPTDIPLGFDLRWEGDMASIGTVHLSATTTSWTVPGLNSGESVNFWIKTTGDGGGIAESTEATTSATIS